MDRKKLDSALWLLRQIPQDGPIEVSYSGGKDSDVILELAKMAGIPFEAIYKNTTIDRPGTLGHVREMGVTVVQPKKSFLELMRENGWPTRWMRFCCSILKEYKIHDRAVQGIRRSESTARAKRYKEPEYCRVYGKDNKVRVYLPILYWTDQDVAEFIAERGIKCHPHYYDENGAFHVERRVGCVGCPLSRWSGRQDFLDNPKMLRAWASAYKVWFDNHPEVNTRKWFPDIYHNLYFKFFLTSMDEYERTFGEGQLFKNNVDVKGFLEEYFNIDLDF